MPRDERPRSTTKQRDLPLRLRVTGYDADIFDRLIIMMIGDTDIQGVREGREMARDRLAMK